MSNSFGGECGWQGKKMGDWGCRRGREELVLMIGKKKLCERSWIDWNERERDRGEQVT